MKPVPRAFTQPLTYEGQALPVNVAQFWQWAFSNLTDNVARGIFAEFIVAHALGITGEIRKAWSPVDMVTPEGLRVEVKAAAYWQDWFQRKPSAIRLGIAPTRAWQADTGKFEAARRRQADVYAFSILENLEDREADPLALEHWTFYVVAARELNSRVQPQKSIGLKKLLTERHHELMRGVSGQADLLRVVGFQYKRHGCFPFGCCLFGLEERS